MPRTNLRWPLVVITGEDGITFDNMLVTQTEVPPMRFSANYKQPGQNYVRGILEGNGDPPGDDMWVTYSMNKEDLWVTKIPVPVIPKVNKPVNDTFEDEDALEIWNTYNPKWAPVERIEFRTGYYRRQDNVKYFHEFKEEFILNGADDPKPQKAVYYIDDLKIE